MTMSESQAGRKRHRMTAVVQRDKPKEVVRTPSDKQPKARPEKLSWRDPRTWEDVT